MKITLSFLAVLLSVGCLFALVMNQPSSTTLVLEETNAANQENFDKMMSVLTHQRCVNCHPNDGVPKQGEDSHPHNFGVHGKDDTHGFKANRCTNCHQSENNVYSGVPGAPEWSLAPPSMKWEGLTPVEIAQSMMDPMRNGGRTPEEVMHHLTEHELVLWAWKPGVDPSGQQRETPPLSKEEYIQVVKQWFEDGAVIPSAKK